MYVEQTMGVITEMKEKWCRDPDKFGFIFLGYAAQVVGYNNRCKCLCSEFLSLWNNFVA